MKLNNIITFRAITISFNLLQFFLSIFFIFPFEFPRSNLADLGGVFLLNLFFLIPLINLLNYLNQNKNYTILESLEIYKVAIFLNAGASLIFIYVIIGGLSTIYFFIGAITPILSFINLIKTKS